MQPYTHTISWLPVAYTSEYYNFHLPFGGHLVLWEEAPVRFYRTFSMLSHMSWGTWWKLQPYTDLICWLAVVIRSMIIIKFNLQFGIYHVFFWGGGRRSSVILGDLVCFRLLPFQPAIWRPSYFLNSCGILGDCSMLSDMTWGPYAETSSFKLQHFYFPLAVYITLWRVQHLIWRHVVFFRSSSEILMDFMLPNMLLRTNTENFSFVIFFTFDQTKSSITGLFN